MAQNTLKIRARFSHFIFFSPVVRKKLSSQTLSETTNAATLESGMVNERAWADRSVQACQLHPQHLVGRAAKHNTVLLATIFPSTVLRSWQAEKLKENYNLVLLSKRKKKSKVIKFIITK